MAGLYCGTSQTPPSQLSLWSRNCTGMRKLCLICTSEASLSPHYEIARILGNFVCTKYGEAMNLTPQIFEKASHGVIAELLLTTLPRCTVPLVRLTGNEWSNARVDGSHKKLLKSGTKVKSITPCPAVAKNNLSRVFRLSEQTHLQLMKKEIYMCCEAPSPSHQMGSNKGTRIVRQTHSNDISKAAAEKQDSTEDGVKHITCVLQGH